MAKSSEWEDFFDGHAPDYMDNPFTGNTLQEVDFVLKEFGLPAGIAILDIGCGTGRHSVELASRGYKMTGIDMDLETEQFNKLNPGVKKLLLELAPFIKKNMKTEE